MVRPWQMELRGRWVPCQPRLVLFPGTQGGCQSPGAETPLTVYPTQGGAEAEEEALLGGAGDEAEVLQREV